MKEKFMNRKIGFYLALGTAVVAVISAILYLVLDGSDRTFSLASFIVVLLGGLSSVSLIFFKKMEYLAFVPTLLYCVGFAFTLRVTMPSVSDLWNHVNFIGGNAGLGITFSILFFLCSVMMVVTNFIGVGDK